jgi:hypothetical protein
MIPLKRRNEKKVNEMDNIADLIINSLFLINMNSLILNLNIVII